MSPDVIEKETEETEEQDQTVETEETTQAGEETKTVDTAVTEEETSTEKTGLQTEEKEGMSPEAIMGEETPKTDGEIPIEKGVSPEGQERINRKIGGAIKDRNIAQNENKQLQEKITQLETVQTAPTERPKAPNQDMFDTLEQYQEAMDKYQDDTYAYHKAQEVTVAQTKEAQAREVVNSDRFVGQVNELKERFPDIDVYKVINETNYGYAKDNILNSTHSAKIGLYLAKNPSENARIGSITNSEERKKEIWKIEARFDSVKTKKTTKAPAALNTITSKGETVVKNINEIKNDDDWYKERQKEKMRKFKEKQKS